MDVGTHAITDGRRRLLDNAPQRQREDDRRRRVSAVGHEPPGAHAHDRATVAAAVPPEHELNVLRLAAITDDAADPATDQAVALDPNPPSGDRVSTAARANARPHLADARQPSPPELDIRTESVGFRTCSALQSTGGRVVPAPGRHPHQPARGPPPRSPLQRPRTRCQKTISMMAGWPEAIRYRGEDLGLRHQRAWAYTLSRSHPEPSNQTILQS